MARPAQQRKDGRRYGGWIIAGACAAVVAGIGYAYVMALSGGGGAGANDPEQVALGREVYTKACASCHGANLEGQPDWKMRQANGRLPAPPHNDTGHTWHHPDQILFEMAKLGIEALAPEGYESDMPGFADTLSDEQIRAVIAYIKSTWPAQISARQESISRQYDGN